MSTVEMTPIELAEEILKLREAEKSDYHCSQGLRYRILALEAAPVLAMYLLMAQETLKKVDELGKFGAFDEADKTGSL